MAAPAVWRRTAFLLAMAVAGGCGGGGGGSDTASPTTTVAPAVTTTARPVDTSFTGAGSGNFCSVAKSYNDRFANVGSATTPAQLKTVMQDGKTAINQAAGAAPAEIKTDVQAIATAFTRLADAFERANYDATKIDLSALQSLQTTDFQAATERFQAYLRNVCKVGA